MISVPSSVVLAFVISVSATSVTMASPDELPAPGKEAPKPSCPSTSQVARAEASLIPGRLSMDSKCDVAATRAQHRPTCVDKDFAIRAVTTPSPSKEVYSKWFDYLSAPFTDLGDEMVREAKTYIESQPKPTADDIKSYAEKMKQSFKPLPGGEFQMGDFGSITPAHLQFTTNQNNKPLHQVKLSSYAIMDRRVTYADYDMYSRATGTPLLNLDPTPVKSAHAVIRFPDFSATYVTWKGAQDYCHWLGKQMGKSADLPSEAQWEYAARAGGKLTTVGTTVNKDKITDDWLASYASCKSPQYTYSWPVKTYPPNALGLYDFVGYGDEWVADWYDADYYKKAPKLSVDPKGPDSGDERTYRHGSRDISELTFTRGHLDPAQTSDELGFRCAIPGG